MARTQVAKNIFRYRIASGHYRYGVRLQAKPKPYIKQGFASFEAAKTYLKELLKDPSEQHQVPITKSLIVSAVGLCWCASSYSLPPMPENSDPNVIIGVPFTCVLL